MKNIDTLVEDINKLFEEGHISSPKLITELGDTLADVVNTRLAAYKEERKPYLRLSMIGKPDRQIYYEVNGFKGEELSASTKIKFLFGDILEALLLFLAKEAGHTVSEEQQEVIVNGVVGHKDAKIDGVTIDVKTASAYSFKKFEDGGILFDDPFGYVAQLSAYDQQGGGFLVLDKSNGTLCLSLVPQGAIIDAEKRISHIKEVLAANEPPPKCYKEVPDGKSGNMKLPVGCSYCKFKHTCWKDSNDGAGLRTFAYSTGAKFLTTVVKEPRVYEG